MNEDDSVVFIWFLFLILKNRRILKPSFCWAILSCMRLVEGKKNTGMEPAAMLTSNLPRKKEYLAIRNIWNFICGFMEICEKKNYVLHQLRVRPPLIDLGYGYRQSDLISNDSFRLPYFTFYGSLDSESKRMILQKKRENTSNMILIIFSKGLSCDYMVSISYWICFIACFFPVISKFWWFFCLNEREILQNLVGMSQSCEKPNFRFVWIEVNFGKNGSLNIAKK